MLNALAFSSVSIFLALHTTSTLTTISLMKKKLSVIIPTLAVLASGIFCTGLVSENTPMTTEKLAHIILGNRTHYSDDSIVSRLAELDDLSKKTFGSQRSYHNSDSIVARIERLEKRDDPARNSSRNEPNPRDLKNKIDALERTVRSYDSTLNQLRSENRQLTQKLRDIERKLDSLERAKR